MTTGNPPRLPALRQSAQPPLRSMNAEPPLASGRTRWILLGTLGVTAALAMAYVVGRTEGQAQTQTVAQQAALQVQGREADVTKLQAALDRQKRRLHRLEARRQLHLSLIEIEDHNFGTARAHLVRAHAELAETHPDDQSAEGILLREMADLKLPVATDIAPARQRLQHFAQRLDQSLAPNPALTAKSTPVEVEEPEGLQLEQRL